MEPRIVTDDVAQHFRKAMRALASTVSIVTCSENGAWAGMVATAVSSLSIDPPSLLVCINRSSSMHPFMARAETFCVNLLHHTQFDVCDAFTAHPQGAARFAAGAWRAVGDEPPSLVDAQVSVFCKVDQIFYYATHTIFVGLVERVRTASEVMPLIYQDGAYMVGVELPHLKPPIAAVR